MDCGTDFSSSSLLKIAAMHTSTKKAVVPYGRPKLTVVRSLNELSKPNQELKAIEKEKKEKRWLMPEQPSGYIKSRKHDCL
jgi:hypothetical protein